MGFFSNLARHPRRLLIRRALFQVHLWIGVLLSLYVAVIGLSGSALVWEDELRGHALRHLHYDAAHMAPAQQVIRNAAAAAPGAAVTYFMWPQVNNPVYTVYLRDAQHERRVLQADPNSGTILPQASRLAIDWVHELHVYLLLGHTGFVINCAAGIGLLVLTLTGFLLWWPGVRLWVRALRVSTRGSWKRMNYDLHNAIGIWTLLIVSFWGLTAIAFLWPEQTAKAVGFVSPVRGMRAPVAPKAAQRTVPVAQGMVAAAPDLDGIVAKAHAVSPNAFLSGISLSATPGGNLTAYMDAREPGDFSHRDIHTFAADGRLLTTWHYGENQTAGDWILWLVYPLHFGTLWGTPVKVVWTLLGLSLPLLSFTGLLMYWNRFLSKRMARLRL